MITPKDLMFSKSHEWVKFFDDGTALTGLTYFAQNALGDLVFIRMPVEGDSVTSGESYTEVESVKAVADIYSHVTGVVKAVNDEVGDSPQKINEDPYGSWIIKVGDITGKSDLMNTDEYDKFCAEECSEEG
jgi:glycine cleavage system H protein